MAEDASDNREAIRKEWFALLFFPFDATSIPIEQLDRKSAAGKNKTSEQKAGLREGRIRILWLWKNYLSWGRETAPALSAVW